MNHSEVIVRHPLTQIDIPITTPGVTYRHPMTIPTASVTHGIVSHKLELRGLLMRLITMIPMRGIYLALTPGTPAPLMGPPDWTTMVLNENSLMILADLNLDTHRTIINGLLHHHTIVLRIISNDTRLDQIIILSPTTTGFLLLMVEAHLDPAETHVTTAVVTDPLTHIPSRANIRVPTTIATHHHLYQQLIHSLQHKFERS